MTVTISRLVDFGTKVSNNVDVAQITKDATELAEEISQDLNSNSQKEEAVVVVIKK